MVGTFLEPSCGRRDVPIHSILHSVAQPLERGSNNYYFIIQGRAAAARAPSLFAVSSAGIYFTVARRISIVSRARAFFPSARYCVETPRTKAMMKFAVCTGVCVFIISRFEA